MNANIKRVVDAVCVTTGVSRRQLTKGRETVANRSRELLFWTCRHWTLTSVLSDHELARELGCDQTTVSACIRRADLRIAERDPWMHEAGRLVMDRLCPMVVVEAAAQPVEIEERVRQALEAGHAA